MTKSNRRVSMFIPFEPHTEAQAPAEVKAAFDDIFNRMKAEMDEALLKGFEKEAELRRMGGEI